MNTTSEQPSRDYDRVARAIEFIESNVQGQPSLDDVAAHIHLSSFHFQRLFSRWAGISPKQFLQVITLERAKQILNQPSSLLDASESIGLSSSSRLHDHFVAIEAVTPGEFKTKGKGLRIEYGISETPFGSAFVATTDRGICKLAFIENDAMESELSSLKSEWPNALLEKNSHLVSKKIERIFSHAGYSGNTPVPLHVSGTNFQINVWKSLLKIPQGNLVSYADIALAIGKPKAVRAVGTAIGANPVGFLIPCHRVIRQSGALGGYRWGLTRKQALIGWEAYRSDPPAA